MSAGLLRLWFCFNAHVAPIDMVECHADFHQGWGSDGENCYAEEFI
jgi:hypothetical protein